MGTSSRMRAAASAFAITGLLSAYAQIVRASSSYAGPVDCSNVTDETQWDAAINAAMRGTCAAITVTSDFTLSGNSVTLDLRYLPTAQEVTITAAGGAAIGGDGTWRPLNLQLDPNDSVTISALQVDNGYNGGLPGGAMVGYGGSITLDDVTFRYAGSVVNGGAIYLKNSSSVTVSDSTFSSNQATVNGGAISMVNVGDVVIEGSTFSQNQADGQGGALWLSGGGTVEVIDSTFIDNDSLYAAAISVDTTMEVSGSYFFNNVATGSGGAIGTSEDLTVADTEFARNIASDGGAAIYLGAASDVEISESSFVFNDAAAGGAIYSKFAADLQIASSSFGFNVANGAGGAIYATTLDIRDSVLLANEANGAGGAIYASGDVYVLGSTIWYNEAREDGGGIRADDVDFVRSAVVRNASLEEGGGIMASGSVTLTNSSVLLNVAQYGAGGVVASDLLAEFSTIAGNQATGPGVVTDLSVRYAATLQGTAVIGLGLEDACDLGTSLGSYTLSSHGSCIIDGFDGNQVTAVDTFYPLDFQQSYLPGDLSALPQPGSVMISAAPDNDLGTGITVDQRGFPRSGTWTIGSRQFVAAPEPAPEIAVPGAPVGPVANPGDGSVTVSWSPPADGGPVQRYTVVAAPGGALCTTLGETTCTVTGLANGVRYSFAVTASNSTGAGPASTVAATPAARDPLAARPVSLGPGAVLLLVDGVPTPAASRRASRPRGLAVSGLGLAVRFTSRGRDGKAIAPTRGRALVLRSQPSRAKAPVLAVSGSGFAPNSPVRLYLLPGTLLGELTADAGGVVSGRVRVPAGVAPGNDTLQMNGLAPGGAVRSLNLGVVVRAASASLRSAWTWAPTAGSWNGITRSPRSGSR